MNIADFVEKTLPLSPVISIHMVCALAAIIVGPFAIWARQRVQPRPIIHRAAGYAFVTLLLMVCCTAMFIRDYRMPNILGYTPVHLLIPYSLFHLLLAFRKLFAGNIKGHRYHMLALYIGACVIAGIFTLLPGRYLGMLIWRQWLGWI